MQKRTFSTLLASAAILGSAMVGCSGARMDRRPALTAGDAASRVPRVERLLASKDFARALLEAETLVAAQPNEGAYRALLGRAYLGNGRYVSARQAFDDAMALGNRDARTIVSLALAQTAVGDAETARALLVAHVQDLPAADYGLAMAMAGNPREGVRALLEAVRQPGATAQTRQNLAYALALGGAWGQARLIAGQDLAGHDAERRIAQWSQQMAGGGSPEQRVVAMIGVSPRADDGGVPMRLALNRAAAPVELAAADPAPPAGPAPAAAVELAASAQRIAAMQPPAPPPPPTETMVVATALAGEAAAPVVRAPAEPMRLALREAFQRSAGSNSPEAMVARSAMSRVAPAVAVPAPDAEASDWVVQLGAFDSEAVAQEKWARISHIRQGLGEFSEIHSQISLDGRAYHRLAIRGFGDRTEAQAMCRSLRANGQACFVRLDDTQSTRMARAQARGGQQMAANGVGGARQRLAVR